MFGKRPRMTRHPVRGVAEAVRRGKMEWVLGAGALVTGFATGWFVRCFATSTRGALVGLVVVAHRAHHDATRIIGQTMEWVEDVIAEGKAQYERTRPPHDPKAG